MWKHQASTECHNPSDLGRLLTVVRAARFGKKRGPKMASIIKASIMGALLVAVVTFGTSQAKADNVTFSTSGVFTCGGCAGSGTNSVTFLGGMGNAFMLTFTGLGSTMLNTPTGTSFGDFQTFVSGGGAIGSGTFTLTITQTAPT